MISAFALLHACMLYYTNQKLIAFESKAGSTGFDKLLRVADGTIETARSQPLNTPYAYQLRTWLDTTRLYLTRYDTDVPPDALAVLDLQLLAPMMNFNDQHRSCHPSLRSGSVRPTRGTLRSAEA